MDDGRENVGHAVKPNRSPPPCRGERAVSQQVSPSPLRGATVVRVAGFPAWAGLGRGSLSSRRPTEYSRRVHEGGRMPALYIGHGAPPLVDDSLWVAQLAAWAQALPRPSAILMVSAPERGLDHGAYVPLTVMYPAADIPVLQVSMPSLDPEELFEIGRRLRPLRDQGVLVIGSGFLTHGLPFLRDFRQDAPPPAWSTEFDTWAHEALEHGDVDELSDFIHRAPAVRYAHPRTEHLAPLFVTLGAGDSTGEPLPSIIDGYWMGLSKRSIQIP